VVAGSPNKPGLQLTARAAMRRRGAHHAAWPNPPADRGSGDGDHDRPDRAGRRRGQPRARGRGRHVVTTVPARPPPAAPSTTSSCGGTSRSSTPTRSLGSGEELEHGEGTVILTPHPGEQVGCSARPARRSSKPLPAPSPGREDDAIVLLKGRARSSARRRTHVPSGSRLATAGSGDVDRNHR
jgi:hypothetical protein